MYIYIDIIYSFIHIQVYMIFFSPSSSQQLSSAKGPLQWTWSNSSPCRRWIYRIDSGTLWHVFFWVGLAPCKIKWSQQRGLEVFIMFFLMFPWCWYFINCWITVDGNQKSGEKTSWGWQLKSHYLRQVLAPSKRWLAESGTWRMGSQDLVRG